MPLEISEMSVKLSVGQMARTASAAAEPCGDGPGGASAPPPASPQQIEELFESFARRIELLRRYAEGR